MCPAHWAPKLPALIDTEYAQPPIDFPLRAGEPIHVLSPETMVRINPSKHFQPAPPPAGSGYLFLGLAIAQTSMKDSSNSRWAVVQLQSSGALYLASFAAADLEKGSPTICKPMAYGDARSLAVVECDELSRLAPKTVSGACILIEVHANADVREVHKCRCTLMCSARVHMCMSVCHHPPHSGRMGPRTSDLGPITSDRTRRDRQRTDTKTDTASVNSDAPSSESTKTPQAKLEPDLKGVGASSAKEKLMAVPTPELLRVVRQRLSDHPQDAKWFDIEEVSLENRSKLSLANRLYRAAKNRWHPELKSESDDGSEEASTHMLACTYA